MIRDTGAQLAKIEIAGESVAFEDPMQRNLVAEASCQGVTTYGKGAHTHTHTHTHRLPSPPSHPENNATLTLSLSLVRGLLFDW